MAGNIGDTVRASLRGIVIRASNQGGHGKRVVLKHPWGYTTSYSHLSKIFVRPEIRSLKVSRSAKLEQLAEQQAPSSF